MAREAYDAIGGREGDTASSTGPAREDTGSSGADASRLTEEFGARLGEIGAELRRLLSLRIEQGRLRLRRILFLAGIGLGAAWILAVATALAVWHLLAGLAGWLGEAFGAAWAGDLAAGSIVIGLLVVLVLVVRWRVRRAGLARLRRKYEPRGAPARPAHPRGESEA